MVVKRSDLSQAPTNLSALALLESIFTKQNIENLPQDSATLKAINYLLAFPKSHLQV